MRPALRLTDVPEKYLPLLVRDRAGLMAEIDTAWRALDGFVGDLSRAQWSAVIPGLGEGAATWRVKDAVAHLAAWRRNAAKVARLQAAAGRHIHDFPGATLGFRASDFNAQLLRDWHGRSREEVLAEHRAAHSDLLATLPLVSDHLLLRRKRSPLWLTPALGHTYDHLTDLMRAL
ncbi:MAG TPA: maleylpyruvate isomerase N-terminal domain-containing protein [Candidatus Dormibacteraeota bacterium]|nr:maleylpyruvate isomerase N-terminal domain-containing protein [Candidatus Dormibacteraeota bacterium]